MKKGIVIYESKTNFTKKYAENIAKGLGLESINISQDKSKKAKWLSLDLSKYEYIIYGGPIYASTIVGLKEFREKIKAYPKLKVYIFATGTAPNTEKALDTVIQTNILKQDLNPENFYYLRGGFDYQRLPLRHKILMSIFMKIMASKKDSTEDQKLIANSKNKRLDFYDKESMNNLIEEIKLREIIK